jgi:HEAT repeat protein
MRSSGSDLKIKAERVLAQLPPRFRKETRQRVADLFRAGVSTAPELLSFVGAEARPEELRVVGTWLLPRVIDTRTARKALAKLLLTSASSRVRSEAAQGLASTGGTRASEALIEALRGDKDVHVRAASANALGFSGDATRVNDLLPILNLENEDPIVRGSVAEALGHLLVYRRRRNDVIGALTRAAHDSSTEVRFWSVFAIGQIGSSRELALLEQIARYDNEKVPHWGSVRAEASEAIRTITARQRAK